MLSACCPLHLGGAGWQVPAGHGNRTAAPLNKRLLQARRCKRCPAYYRLLGCRNLRPGFITPAEFQHRLWSVEDHTDGPSPSACLDAPEVGAGSSGMCTFQTRGNGIQGRSSCPSRQVRKHSGGSAVGVEGLSPRWEPRHLVLRCFPHPCALSSLCSALTSKPPGPASSRSYRCHGSPGTSQPHAEPDWASSSPSEKISQSRMP